MLLSTSRAEASLDPGFNQPAGQLGINLSNPGPDDSSALWTNVAKDFANWQYAGTNTALSGSDVTQNGFPSGTAASNGANASSYLLGYPNGDYELQYQGAGTISFSGSASVVPGTTRYNAATDTTTSVVDVEEANSTVEMTASGLRSGDPLHNFYLMMPGFTPGTTQIVNPSVASRLGAFGTIRLMDAFDTNSDLDSNWSQLASPNSFSFAGASGISYVDAIALGNETNSNLWWNVPVNASDAFVTSLADLLKYGADANGNPYTIAQSNPIYAPLNAGLKVHIEYGNELENFTQPTVVANDQHAYANLSTGILDGSLEFDGEEEFFRLHQIYEDFQAVYSPGGTGFSSQVGFVFGGAFSSSGPDAFTSSAFQFAAENNHLSGQNNPANWGPISGWLEAVATSDYHGLTSAQESTLSAEQAASGELPLADLFSDLNADLQASSSTASKAFVSKPSINVPLYGYEGGQGLVGSDPPSDALFLAAQNDPRMGTFYQSIIDQWYNNGGSLLNLYSFATPYSNGSAWGLLPSAIATGSAKWDAVVKRLVPIGDASLDGSVNYRDFQILNANWGSAGAAWQTGDFDGDGVVNQADLVLLEQNINTSSFTSSQLATYNSFVSAATNSNTPSTPGTPNFSAVTSSTVSITWAGSFDHAGIADYLVFRNGIRVGTSPTNSFSDSGLTAGNVYNYSIEAVDNASITSAPSRTLAVTTALPLIALTGNLIGTSGSYNNDGETAANAFDGNFSTFFDGPTANGDWAGLDLGSAKTIAAISYAPRGEANFNRYEPRMVGGVFQYASDAGFSNPVTFYTIPSAPADGYTTVALPTPITARYVRYLGPDNSYGNIAELDFYANLANLADKQLPTVPGTPTILTPATKSTVSITWTASTDNTGVDHYVVFRNNLKVGTSTTNTFSDNGLAAGTTYNYTVEAVDAAGSPSLASASLPVTTLPASNQLTGAIIGTAGSYDGLSTIAKVFDGNTATFFDAPTANGNWAGLDLGSAYSITSISYVPRAASGGFAYEGRMVGGIFQASNTADFSSGVVNLFTVTAQPGDATTTQAVTSGAYRYVRYLAPAGSYGNVAELAFFGTAGIATQAPGRPTLTSSTSATATIGWTASPSVSVSQYIVLRNNVQIGTTSATNFTYSDSGLSASTTYSYTVEAVASGDTSAASAPLSVTTPAINANGRLTGTIIGTTGSYDGVSTSAKALDGSTSTFFDAPNASVAWVGLDLGAGVARTITSVTFAPRAASGGFAYESRMVGGIFQASNTADFSGGAVNLYTITSTPKDGYTSVAVSAPGTYRYFRYLAPGGSYGNIAELQFFGY